MSAYLILDTVFEVDCDDVIVAAELSRLLSAFERSRAIGPGTVRITVRRAPNGLRVAADGQADPRTDADRARDLDPDAAIGQVVGIVNRTAPRLRWPRRTPCTPGSWPGPAARSRSPGHRDRARAR